MYWWWVPPPALVTVVSLSISLVEEVPPAEAAPLAELVSSADAPSGYHCDDGFRAGSDLTLKIQNVQTRNAVAADIASVASDLLISAGAKGIFPLTGEDNDTDVFIVASVS